MTLIPQFIDGETVQAVATTRFVPGADQTHKLEESFNVFRFESELYVYKVSPPIHIPMELNTCLGENTAPSSFLPSLMPLGSIFFSKMVT